MNRPLILLLACNEAESLPCVVREVCHHFPASDVLVVDDASDDATAQLLPSLGVGWIRLPQRTGVGGAVRCGLQHALGRGYDTVVRLDGDGQHVAPLAFELLDALRRDGADAAVGSRYKAGGGYRASWARRLAQRLLGVGLSLRLGSRVTDPTSGFCALGCRAIRMLSTHHPTGYAEAELRLFLTRSGLRAIEVPVRARRRFSGRTSLTSGRLASAAARAVLALLIVPLRAAVEDAGD